jgi:transglutaminase-like putative cysteine protease
VPDQDDALTRLVQEHVGRGRRLTFRAFEDQAVDPLTGYRISKSTAQELTRGHQIKITPPVLRAIAAGIGEDPARVRAAAIRQYIGIEVTDPFQTPADGDDTVVRVAHEVGATAEELEQVKRALDNPRPESGVE